MQRRLAALRPSVEIGATIVLFACLAAAAVLFGQHMVQAVLFRYPLDYGEAPLVDQALRLAAGANIYRPDLATPPYTVANYPPLYPLALALLVKLFGPSLIAGRLISIVCAVLTATLLGKIVGVFSRDRIAAAVAGLIFLAFPFVLGWAKLARVDLLALALSLAGLYTLVRWPGRRGVIGGGLLIVAAIYTRQSYALAAPLAGFIWLWTQNRRSAVGFAALVGGVSLVLFLALNTLTNGGFFFNVVTANANEFKLDNLAYWWRQLRSAAPILLVLGVAYLVLRIRWAAPQRSPRNVGIEASAGLIRHERDRLKPRFHVFTAWPLVAPYLLASALSALTIGKIGSNMNYLLELCTALSLVAGAAVAWSRGRSWLRPALLLALTLQTGLLMRASLRDPVAGLRWRVAQPRSALAELEQIVAVADGPILADEFMGLLTLQNKPLYIQPFEITQLANAGLWNQAPLLADIRARAFPAIFIHHFPGYPVYQERWTPEMLDAILTYYAASAFLAETVVYRPADPATDPPADIEACPAAPWRLPTRSELGLWREGDSLAFMGAGYERSVPVYAVADGLLTRDTAWRDGVAIRHADPLHLGEAVWAVYGGMASAWGGWPFIEPRFPPGSKDIPVRRGDLLGYQGQYSAQWGTPYWVHLEFAIVPALPDGSLPAGLLKGPASPAAAGAVQALDPVPYLGIVSGLATEHAVWMPLRCGIDAP